MYSYEMKKRDHHKRHLKSMGYAFLLFGIVVILCCVNSVDMMTTNNKSRTLLGSYKNGVSRSIPNKLMIRLDMNERQYIRMCGEFIQSLITEKEVNEEILEINEDDTKLIRIFKALARTVRQEITGAADKVKPLLHTFGYIVKQLGSNNGELFIDDMFEYIKQLNDYEILTDFTVEYIQKTIRFKNIMREGRATLHHLELFDDKLRQIYFKETSWMFQEELRELLAQFIPLLNEVGHGQITVDTLKAAVNENLDDFGEIIIHQLVADLQVYVGQLTESEKENIIAIGKLYADIIGDEANDVHMAQMAEVAGDLISALMESDSFRTILSIFAQFNQ